MLQIHCLSNHLHQRYATIISLSIILPVRSTMLFIFQGGSLIEEISVQTSQTTHVMIEEICSEDTITTDQPRDENVLEFEHDGTQSNTLIEELGQISKGEVKEHYDRAHKHVLDLDREEKIRELAENAGSTIDREPLNAHKELRKYQNSQSSSQGWGL